MFECTCNEQELIGVFKQDFVPLDNIPEDTAKQKSICMEAAYLKARELADFLYDQYDIKLKFIQVKVDYPSCHFKSVEALQEVYRKQPAEINPTGMMPLENDADFDVQYRKAVEFIHSKSPEWWARVLTVNLKSAYLCCLAFCRYAEPKGWGRIVNVSSARAYRPAEPEMVAYTVSKLGMHSLTRSFAARCAPFNITVNTLVPGMIATENLMNRIGQSGYDAECGNIPLHRAGTCDEIADGVVWALHNGFMTGESISINGGQTYAP